MDAHITPQFAANAALEAYRTRVIATLTFLDDASAGRIQLPTNKEQLAATIEGCVSYLLEGEEDFKMVDDIISKQKALLAELQAAEEQRRKHKERYFQLIEELGAVSEASDVKLTKLQREVDSLREVKEHQQQHTVDMSTLINAAERFAYSTTGKIMPPFPSAADQQASTMMQMQIEATLKAASGVAAGGSGWINLDKWFNGVVPGREVPLDMLPPESHEPSSDNIHVEDIHVPSERLSPTVHESAEKPTPLPTAQSVAASMEAVSASIVTPAEIVKDAMVVDEPPAVPVASQVPQSAVETPVVVATTTIPAAPQAPRAPPTLRLDAMPPAVRDIIMRHFPRGWKPGDPLPANLPDLTVLLRQATASSSATSK